VSKKDGKETYFSLRATKKLAEILGFREREIARSIYNEGSFSKWLGRESFESEAAAAFK
jgi:hypothetical protein